MYGHGHDNAVTDANSTLLNNSYLAEVHLQ